MLPKNKRVTTELFKKVLKEGKSIHTPALSFKYYRETTPGLSRFSVFVPKKVLKLASKRNYLKRKINTSLSKVYSKVENSFVGVIYAKNSTIGMKPEELSKEIEEIFKRGKIIN
jgi:ribonuclease P protein component